MIQCVTGATGFVGSHLVEALRSSGEPVRALVRTTADAGRLQALGVEVVRGHLGEPSTLLQFLDGADRVYHCAALVSDYASPEAFRQTNVLGVANLVDACRQVGVGRLVHLSSSDVYGHPDAPVGEDAPLRTRGYGYGDSKIAGEGLVWAAHREHGLPVTVLRPSNLYGPRCRPFVLEVLAALRAGLLFHFSGPPRPMGLGYVGNVVDALRLAARHDAALGQAFNVHDGLDLGWNGYVDRLADGAGLRRPLVSLPHRAARRVGQALEVAWRSLRLAGRPPLTRLAMDLLGTHQGFSIEKIRIALGYRPRVGFEEGLGHTFGWLRAEGLMGPGGGPRQPEAR